MSRRSGGGGNEDSARLAELEEGMPFRYPTKDNSVAYQELARRLLGRRPGSEKLERRVDPTDEAQMQTWVNTAKYLAGRIQYTTEHKQGRHPDMSPAAAAVFLAVLLLRESPHFLAAHGRSAEAEQVPVDERGQLRSAFPWFRQLRRRSGQ